MKHLFAAPGLILIGLLLFAFGYVGSGGQLSVLNGDLGPLSVRMDFDAGEADPARADSYTCEIENLEEIVLKEFCGSVEVRPSYDGKVHIDYEHDETHAMQIRKNGTRLQIERKEQIGLLFFGFLRSPDFKTVLRLPDALDCDVSVHASNDPVSAKDLFLDSHSTLLLQSSNGAVRCTDCTLGSLTLRSSNGETAVSDTKAQGHVEIQNSNGKIRVRTLTCQSFVSKASNGRTELEALTAKAGVQADDSNGAITVQALSGQDISIHTSNGGISGTIQGARRDYTIEAHTRDGSCNLPEKSGDGPRTLTLRSSNGKIDIAFTDE